MSIENRRQDAEELSLEAEYMLYAERIMAQAGMCLEADQPLGYDPELLVPVLVNAIDTAPDTDDGKARVDRYVDILLRLPDLDDERLAKGGYAALMAGNSDGAKLVYARLRQEKDQNQKAYARELLTRKRGFQTVIPAPFLSNVMEAAIDYGVPPEQFIVAYASSPEEAWKRHMTYYKDRSEDDAYFEELLEAKAFELAQPNGFLARVVVAEADTALNALSEAADRQLMVQRFLEAVLTVPRSEELLKRLVKVGRLIIDDDELTSLAVVKVLNAEVNGCRVGFIKNKVLTEAKAAQVMLSWNVGLLRFNERSAQESVGYIIKEIHGLYVGCATEKEAQGLPMREETYHAIEHTHDELLAELALTYTAHADFAGAGVALAAIGDREAYRNTLQCCLDEVDCEDDIEALGLSEFIRWQDPEINLRLRLATAEVQESWLLTLAIATEVIKTQGKLALPEIAEESADEELPEDTVSRKPLFSEEFVLDAFVELKKYNWGLSLQFLTDYLAILRAQDIAYEEYAYFSNILVAAGSVDEARWAYSEITANLEDSPDYLYDFALLGRALRTAADT